MPSKTEETQENGKRQSKLPYKLNNHEETNNNSATPTSPSKSKKRSEENKNNENDNINNSEIGSNHNEEPVTERINDVNIEDKDKNSSQQENSSTIQSSHNKDEQSVISIDDTHSTHTPILTPPYNEEKNSNKKQVDFKTQPVTEYRYFDDDHNDLYSLSDEIQDNSEQSSGQQETTEDDNNTVNSDQTSSYRRRDMEKIILPPMTRYQIMLMLDHDNNNMQLTEDEDEEIKPPTQRIREFLIKMVEQINNFDADAKIVSWKTSPNFTYLESNNFPEDIVGIATYWNGFRANLKADKRIYMKVAIHTPNSQENLQENISNWMDLHAYSFKKCIIQAESASYIGWLAYSTPFTDIEVIKNKLEEMSRFEWGFKQVAVTNSDKDQKWLTRLKAIGVYVPSQMEQIAKAIIGEHLEASLQTDISMPEYSDKYLFVRPEKEMMSNKQKQIYYKDIVRRHRTHCNSIHAKLSFDIRVDLDQEFYFNKSHIKLTLRDIILDIKVSDRDNPLFGTSLFHAVDFVGDSGKLWIDGQLGPGGSCHIFSFYKQTESEATTMITGLGKYVLKKYGKTTAATCFTSDHFRASKGWRYNVITGLFETPEMRQIDANIKYDHNLSAINILDKLQKEEEEKLQKEKATKEKAKKNKSRKSKADLLSKVSDSSKKERNKKSKDQEHEQYSSSSESQSDCSSDSSSSKDTDLQSHHSTGSNMIEFAEAQELKEIADKRHDPDLDSINADQKNINLKQVQISDTQSTTSSLTDTSLVSNNTYTDFSESTIKSKKNLIGSQMFNISTTLLNKLINGEDLIEDQIYDRVEKYQALQFQKAKDASRSKISALLQKKEQTIKDKEDDNEKEKREFVEDKQINKDPPHHIDNRKKKKKKAPPSAAQAISGRTRSRQKEPASSHNTGNQK